jgi:hypothetical protein
VLGTLSALCYDLCWAWLHRVAFCVAYASLLCVVAAVKELKKNISGVLQDSSLDWDVTLETSSASEKKQSHVCMEFLQSIDQTGELTDTSAVPLDVVKYERNVRAERSSRVLDDAK